MKRHVLLMCLMAMCLTSWASDPEVNTKWGKPSNAEMTMKECEMDPDAKAVVLYSDVEANIDLVSGQFRLTRTVKRRLKVLKPEGRSVADVSFLIVKTKMKDGTYANKISATAYNIENGQVVATKLKNDLIFHEDLSEKVTQYKFSVPQVSVGTVIEYQYTVSSTRYWDVDTWYAQEGIPVLYTHYQFSRPRNLNFHLEQTGLHPVESKTSEENMNLIVGSGTLSTAAEIADFTGRNVPALKDDKSVFCVNDYRTRVKAELNFISIPEAGQYKEYTTTWSRVVEDFCKDEDFGGRIFRKSPLRQQIESLGISKIDNVEERVTALWNLMQEKITWNGRVDLYPTRTRSTVNDGYGTNSDVNCLLIQMLRDAGIPAWPVLVRHRTAGRIPATYPSTDAFTTFIVAYSTDEEETYNFLDASCKYGYIDALEPNLMSAQGLLMHEDQSGKWIDLQGINGNNLIHQITAKIDADGMLTGHMQQIYRKGRAYSFRTEWADVKDSAQYVNGLAVGEDVELTNYQHEGANGFGPTVVVNYDFERQTLVSGGKIYCPTLVLPQQTEEHFTAEKRDLPVEFPYQQSERITVSLELPEGYTLEQVPQALNISTEDGGLRVTCQSTLQDGKLQTLYQAQIRKTFYGVEEYEALRTIFNAALEKNNEMISIIPAK